MATQVLLFPLKPCHFSITANFEVPVTMFSYIILLSRFMFDIIIKLDTHGLEIYALKGIDKGISDIDITKGKPKIQITGTKESENTYCQPQFM